MLALSPSQRILLAVQPVDFRKGIDGLIGLCRRRLNENPLLGTLFVFTNRRRTALKLLIYDSCEAPCYVELDSGSASQGPDSTEPLHIMRSESFQPLQDRGI